MYNTLRVAVLLASLLVSLTAIAGDEPSSITKGNTKIGTNMLSLLLIGDLNASFERMMSNHIASVVTMHWVQSSQLVSADGEGFRVSGGLRVYGSFEHTGDSFFELKAGVSKYRSDGGAVTAGSGLPLSLEFYLGRNQRFNDFMYYDAKIGLIRFLRSGDVTLGAGFGVGVLF